MDVIILIFFFAMICVVIEDSIKTKKTMPKFEQKQEVKQFIDDNIKVEQEVHLDTEDIEDWLVVTHAGNQLSMSVRNWKSLVELADKVLKKANPEEIKENWEDDLQS